MLCMEVWKARDFCFFYLCQVCRQNDDYKMAQATHTHTQRERKKIMMNMIYVLYVKAPSIQNFAIDLHHFDRIVSDVSKFK